MHCLQIDFATSGHVQHLDHTLRKKAFLDSKYLLAIEQLSFLFITSCVSILQASSLCARYVKE